MDRKSKSIHDFLSNYAHRKADRQTQTSKIFQVHWSQMTVHIFIEKDLESMHHMQDDQKIYSMPREENQTIRFSTK